ncbi:PREDICTED: 4-substituted benzoates-glutamate ligase GH3.12-like isoform X2 [Brassica oleracea var. oleracea]|uniref:4-substituted benzoates-glutamate ligase GH3.12-like isoform X2 n=1 Tax=Brassica oleracea var. oleracea TaxID=109376 RepID=UPI0006A72A64|nr:PREDICTED: 4-substituted benzoates-glutamate ligase GH3.12-like isoform X2 [Brassica oleracea var. oleracea]
MELMKLTSNVKQIQDDVLKEILTLNANTEYLRGYLHGAYDKELFKKNVPVVSYDDVKPYIERVANGEPSNVISGKPITRFLLSSGTSGGKQKIFPVNNKFFEDMAFIFALRSSLISKHIEGDEKGKVVMLFFAREQSITPCGLPISTSVTGYLLSDSFKNRPSNCFTSPDEVTLCPDLKQTMYCHLLCGLRQRDEVVAMAASFASSLVGAVTFFESYWKEICSNIRSGHVSEWITDLSCREAVTNILGGGNSELADNIEEECNKKSWKGIIPRLWPNVKFIQSIVTGQNSQYIPMLEFYSNKVHLFSPAYGSSETMFGVNVNPLCKPEDVSYTFMPNISYFEFILADEGNKGEIVDLVNVEIGSYYEPLITNYYGHYIFYWELKAKNISDTIKPDNKVLVECCCVMEESLSALYREIRSKDGSIGPLEIRVVQQGTFNSLMEFSISQGASPSQYKTPMCIKSSEALVVLDNNVLARFFSDKSRPF